MQKARFQRLAFFAATPDFAGTASGCFFLLGKRPILTPVLAHVPDITQLVYRHGQIAVRVIQRRRGQRRALMGTPAAMPDSFIIFLAMACCPAHDRFFADTAAHNYFLIYILKPHSNFIRADSQVRAALNLNWTSMVIKSASSFIAAEVVRVAQLVGNDSGFSHALIITLMGMPVYPQHWRIFFNIVSHFI